MPRVIHFEISVDDPDRAAKFYSNIFGWRIEKSRGPVDYWLISTGEKNEPGIDGAIKRRQQREEGTTNTIDVPFIDEFIKKVEKNGGKVLMPKMTIPSIGYHTYCRDPDGNVFGIMQSDENAR